MKKIFVLILVLTIFICSSCKKEKEEIENLLKEETSEEIWYSYDEKSGIIGQRNDGESKIYTYVMTKEGEKGEYMFFLHRFSCFLPYKPHAICVTYAFSICPSPTL